MNKDQNHNSINITEFVLTLPCFSEIVSNNNIIMIMLSKSVTEVHNSIAMNVVVTCGKHLSTAKINTTQIYLQTNLSTRYLNFLSDFDEF